MSIIPEPRFRSFPLALGTPLRAPHFAWPAWGISCGDDAHFRALVKESEAAYEIEWRPTTHARHADIAEAARLAGLADANMRLNERVGELGATFLAGVQAPEVRVLDLGSGAGATSLSLWHRLPPDLQRRTRWTLLDPANHALDQARDRLLDAGLRPDQLMLDTRRDLNALPDYRAAFDLVISVAAVHHHAFLDPLFHAIACGLKPGGVFINGDWHNSLSTHPVHILSLMQQLEWPDKQADIDAFRCAYPEADATRSETGNAAAQRANEGIRRFWMAYAQHHRDSAASFLVIEGHRPADHYVRGLQDAGFIVPGTMAGTAFRNPTFLDRGSTLLGIILAHRATKGRRGDPKRDGGLDHA